MVGTRQTSYTTGVAGEDVFHAWGYVAAMLLLILALPPAIYGYLAYRQFDFFRFTYYIPYEELFVALRAADPVMIFSAPLVSANMTSGFLLSSMYNLTVGQSLISLSLGVAMGLSLAGKMTLRKVCATRSVNGSATAAGCGVMATLTASSTGLLGCCAGSALAGGLLSLAGVSATLAGQVASMSPLIQATLMALFVFDCLRVRKRLAVLAMPRAG
jgi:hypothetical protein